MATGDANLLNLTKYVITFHKTSKNWYNTVYFPTVVSNQSQNQTNA